MRKILFFLFLSLLLSPSLLGQMKTLQDALGNSFPVLEAPRRIVSLAPNITEILFALGLGETIVGVTRFCDYPPESMSKEKIGGLVDPSLERIKALGPGVGLSHHSEYRHRDPQRRTSRSSHPIHERKI